MLDEDSSQWNALDSVHKEGLNLFSWKLACATYAHVVMVCHMEVYLGFWSFAYNINDLPKQYTKCRIYMYGDDTVL